jgi:hypothetical protein
MVNTHFILVKSMVGHLQNIQSSRVAAEVQLGTERKRATQRGRVLTSTWDLGKAPGCESYTVPLFCLKLSSAGYHKQKKTRRRRATPGWLAIISTYLAAVETLYLHGSAGLMANHVRSDV